VSVVEEVVKVITRRELVQLRIRAYRRRVWFKALDRVERGIVDLVIRCVDRVRSAKLSEIVVAIVSKLEAAVRDRLARLMDEVGLPFARKVAGWALSWGYDGALGWADDLGFVQYLTVVEMNTPRIMRV